MEKYLIVNADDYGLSPEVNRGVIEAFKKGIVRSISVMVNTPFYDVSKEFIDEGLGIGLHINMTFGKPVSAPENVNSLLDERGMFQNNRNLLLERGSIDDFNKEISSQFKKFIDIFKKPPTHLDTHKHLHREDKGILNIIMEIAKGYEVYVRSSTDGIRALLELNNIKTSDFFLGDVSGEPYWTEKRLCEAIIGISPGISELMCHPGYRQNPVSGISYNEQREVELISLCGKSVREIIKYNKIKLTNYMELKDNLK